MESDVGNQPPRTADSPEVLALVKEGLPIVDMVARSMRRQFGLHVQVEDLAAAGRETLVGAARSYDPARGIPFRRWAILRVRGGMIDAARQNGSLPKRVYRKLRALEAAANVQETLGEETAAAPPPTPEAADAALGDQLATAAMAAAVGFLAMKKSDALDHARDPDRSPESSVGHAQLLQVIKEAIAERPEQERTLLMRHYFEDVTLEDAGKEMGLSKSWASRLHTRAIEAVSRKLRRGGVDL